MESEAGGPLDLRIIGDDCVCVCVCSEAAETEC